MNPVSAYRWQLSEALQSSSDPAQLYAAAARLLARFLGVKRVIHAARDGGDIVVAHEYVDGVVSLRGRHDGSQFSTVARADMFVGRTRVVHDIDSADNLLAPDRTWLRSVGVRAYIVIALAQHWEMAGGFGIHSHEPRVWTSEEIELVVETADRTWDAVKRATAEHELRAAAGRDAYRLKLTDALRKLDDERAIIHAAVHALGEHLHVNRAYYADIANAHATIHPEYLDGVTSFAGTRRVSSWATSNVADMGNAFVVENVATEPRLSEIERSAYLERHTAAFIAVNIFRAGSWIAALVVSTREPRRWTADESALVVDTAQRIWTAISRVRSELQLRESAARDALRLQLADTLRVATDVDDLRARALRLVGEYLKADRLILVERDSTEFIAYADYCTRLPSVAGRHAVSAFPTASAAFERGDTVMTHDVLADEKFSPETRTRFSAFGIRAVLAVPLFRRGELIGALAMHMAEPRRWRDDEVTLLADAGERIWSAIERLNQERELREASRHKDEFIAMLAHELRNPLAPLMTSVELLYRSVEDPRTLIEIAAIMERQLRHIVRLVDDLLDTARISHGAIRIERAATSLTRILDEAAEMHRSACRDRRITLTKTVDQPVNVDVDHVRMVQIVSNLIHNAIKFTDQGGRIDVRATVEDRTVKLFVEDTGVGIEPELLPGVFDLFKHSNDRGGLGVGLALCRQLVELHGGSIHARAREGGSGTVIELELPDSVTEKPVRAKTPSDRPTRAHGSILIVDDNEDIVRATSILISSLGATPHVATDGRSALELAKKVRPLAVLLDIGMPGMNGYEVCQQLRTMFGSDIRLVAYTGWGKTDDKSRALDVGFDIHITKPADTDTLARALLLKR